MGVTIRKKRGKWFVYVHYQGHCKSKCVGDSKAAAEQVKRMLEAKLALGDNLFFEQTDKTLPTFDDYADQWVQNYASIECKESTCEGYKGVLRNYLRPRFGKTTLNRIGRDDLKSMIAEMIVKGLSRGTIKHAIAVIRGIFNYAIEAGVVDSNPAARLGRFTRMAHTSEEKGVALTPRESQAFLDAAGEFCPAYHPLFLAALRAGLRRGELVALQFGDINFGADGSENDRYILVQHNYVHRRHTTTKSQKNVGWICRSSCGGFFSNGEMNFCLRPIWKAKQRPRAT